MRSTLFVIIASIPLAACGGKSKPQPVAVEKDHTADEPLDYQGGEGYGGDQYGGEGEWDEPPPPPPTPPAAAGTWSSGCVNGTVLDAVLTADHYDLTIRAFGDPACAKPTFTVHDTGAYAWGAQSTTAAGAWDLDVSSASHELTVADKATAKTIGKACGIKKMKAGKAYDIHAAGCAAVGVHPAADCPHEFDLVQQDGSFLRLGTRPADGNQCSVEKRPTTIDPAFGLRYVWKPTGVAECDQLIASAEVYVNCNKLPVETRTQVFVSMQMSFADTSSWSTMPAESAAALSDGCKQGKEALTQSVASLGCGTP